jgi:hypothetical protein
MTESNLDERFSGVLAPDTMLPSQFFGALRRGVPLSGERRLMVAVLEDALHCYQKHVDSDDPRHRQLFAEAEEWIEADEPTWFFSFPNVCHTLDLEPDYVRTGLHKWRDARRAATGPARTTSLVDRHSPAADEDQEPPLRRASGA